MPHITLSMLNAKMTSQIEAVSPSVSLAVCSTTSKLSFALLCSLLLLQQLTLQYIHI